MQNQHNNDWQPPRELSTILLGFLFLAAALLLVPSVLIRAPGKMVDGLPLPGWSVIVPFGSLDVALVHVFAGLAICWGLVFHLRPKMGEANRTTVAILIVLGGSLAALTLHYGGLTGFEGWSAGGRFWLRMFWVVVLQLPWCLAAVIVLLPPDDEREPVKPLLPLGIVLLAGTLLPLAHAGHAARRESYAVANYSDQQQYMRAWRHIVILEAFAGVQQIGGQLPRGSFFSVRPVGGVPSRQVRQELVQQLVGQIRVAAQPLSSGTSVSDVMRRASTLLSLDELDEAIKLLELLDERRPDALLLLATIYEENKNYGRAVGVLEEATDRIGGAQGADVVPVVQKIYQRLANNLRRVQRYREAEDRLLQAIERYDHSHGFFYSELGLHCQLGGRFRAAIGYYQACVRAEPRYAPRVEAAIRQLRLETPACFFRPPQLATE